MPGTLKELVVEGLLSEGSLGQSINESATGVRGYERVKHEKRNTANKHETESMGCLDYLSRIWLTFGNNTFDASSVQVNKFKRGKAWRN